MVSVKPPARALYTFEFATAHTALQSSPDASSSPSSYSVRGEKNRNLISLRFLLPAEALLPDIESGHFQLANQHFVYPNFDWKAIISTLQIKILPKRVRDPRVLAPSVLGREIHETFSAEFCYGQYCTESVHPLCHVCMF